ncbi:MAG: hypothetical protein Q7J54_07530 [Candidatus Woesearchaeota archaeon]|nr:hypothetical protein [Candidatus Woesearchaeota archaeon]
MILDVLFGLVPKEYYILISPISLIILGIVIDTKIKEGEGFVGRLSMFSHSMALASFYSSIPKTPLIMKIIVNIAIILGLIGVIAYAMNKSLSHENYYKFTKIFNPLITGLLILIYYIFPTWFI